jgi:putative membrane protein
MKLKNKFSISNNLITKNIKYLIQGALVGVGAILPGVSGGVMCVAFKIYEPMMELLTHPKQALKKHYKMFIPFIIGWVLGFILLAKAVELLFSASAQVALMLFFGLICGTLPELFKVSEKSDPSKSWTPFIISLSLAYLFFHILEGGISTTISPSFWSFLLCGALWGLSLIIPGFSSSSILIYLGLYEPMTEGIGSLNFSVIIPMLIGIISIALLLARLVDMLYKKHYALTSRVILGFVIASSLKILPSSFDNILTLILSIICLVIGFIVARAMDLAEKNKKGN